MKRTWCFSTPSVISCRAGAVYCHIQFSQCVSAFVTRQRCRLGTWSRTRACQTLSVRTTERGHRRTAPGWWAGGTGSWPQHVTPGQDWGRKCSLPVLPCWEPSSRVRWGCTESCRSVARPAVHACRGRLGHCLSTSDDAIASCRWIPGFLLCLTPTGPAKEGSPRARVAGAATPALIIPMLLRQLTVTTPGLTTPWRV